LLVTLGENLGNLSDNTTLIHPLVQPKLNGPKWCTSSSGARQTKPDPALSWDNFNQASTDL